MFIISVEYQAKPGATLTIGKDISDVAKAAGQAAGVEARGWAGITGAPYGTHWVTAAFGTMGEAVAGLGAVQADSASQEIGARIAPQLHQPAELQIYEVAHLVGDHVDLPFLSVTTATLSAGQLNAGLTWAVELVDLISSVTGLTSLVSTAQGGSPQGLMFATMAESPDVYQDAVRKVMADGYLDLADRAGGLFDPGSPNRVLAMAID